MGAGVSAAASAPGAGKSIDFGDINLRAYRGVSEFTNESHIIYNTRMDAALADYRSNPSLNGMPADKVGLVNKSDVLLGTREFVEADFLDFVAQYGFKKDPGANILDGLDRYLGQMITVLGFEPIVKWLYSLHSLKEGTVVLGFKRADAFLTKVFIRGKCMDDLVRAAYLATDFSTFWPKLAELKATLSDFEYWIEDDRPKSGWNTIKIYMCRTATLVRGKTMAVELQLVSPAMWLVMKQSSNHLAYERQRMALDPEVEQLYADLGKVSFSEQCDRLKVISPGLNNLVQKLVDFGAFEAVEGQLADGDGDDLKVPQVSFAAGDVRCLVAPPDNNESSSSTPSSSATFTLGAFHKPDSPSPLQVVNGKLLLAGSHNYYLTREKFRPDGVRIDVVWMGSNICMACCPERDCGFFAKPEHTRGQTCMHGDEHCWLRDKVYGVQVAYHNKLVVKDDNTKHVSTCLVQDGKVEWCFNGEPTCAGTVDGAEIAPGFHFGFFTWGEEMTAAVISVTISKIEPS